MRHALFAVVASTCFTFAIGCTFKEEHHHERPGPDRETIVVPQERTVVVPDRQPVREKTEIHVND